MEMIDVIRLELGDHYEEFYDSGEIYASEKVVFIPIAGISGLLDGATFDGATICLSVDQLRQLLALVEA